MTTLPAAAGELNSSDGIQAVKSSGKVLFNKMLPGRVIVMLLHLVFSYHPYLYNYL